MKLSAYSEKMKLNEPPSVEAGETYKQILSVEPYKFDFDGKTIDAIHLETDLGKRRTTGKVLIEKLTTFFNENVGETLENVKIVKKGSANRRYLDMESF